jgi:hypothetical protein
LHPCHHAFASGSWDQTVIIWSSKTFEVLHRIVFPNWILAVAFGESDTLYVSVRLHGVTSCNARTGTIGHIVIPDDGVIFGLAFGTM